MSQPRKKKILEEVQRQRRRRTITTMAIVVILIAVIVGGIYALTRSSGPGLPPYLDKCISRFFYHSHPQLSIIINGNPQIIPPDVGRQGGCLRPIHTHNTDGVIHVEPEDDRDLTLKDFFLIWGKVFNSTQILDTKAAPGQISMKVNGFPDNSFETYVFPRDASIQSDPCYRPSCKSTVSIEITYPATSSTTS